MKRLMLLKSEARWIADDIEYHWDRTGRVTKQGRRRLVSIYTQWPGLKPFRTMLELGEEAPDA